MIFLSKKCDVTKGLLTYYVVGLQGGRGKWKYYGNNMSGFGVVHGNTRIQFYPKCGNRWRNTSKFMEGLAELSPIIEIKKKKCFKIAHIPCT